MDTTGIGRILISPCLPKHTDITRSAMTVARFDPSGKHIFIGTASGSVLVFNTRTKTVSEIFVQDPY